MSNPENRMIEGQNQNTDGYLQKKTGYFYGLQYEDIGTGVESA